MTLLLKDPKSSCVIEGEKPPQDLIQRWDRVIGEAGWTPLDETVFLRLHRIVIGGMRADMVRNGSLCLVVMLTDETAFLPKAELHEMLISEDIASLVHGLIAFDQASSIELAPVVAAAVLPSGSSTSIHSRTAMAAPGTTDSIRRHPLSGFSRHPKTKSPNTRTY
ncbi:hypothetical protein [Bradyrhizobium sp. 195]|uniref:hypothetical protein n=1 Tax=Bradyrhizobium sp. 195 TaxID=2782662 RepID=UPI003211BA70